MFRNWLRKLRRYVSLSHSRRHRRGKRTQRVILRPRFETLEIRLLPARLILTPAEAVLDLGPAGDQPTTLGMRLVDANASPELMGTGQLPGPGNPFLGNLSGSAAAEVAGNGAVQYQNVYPGINLDYYTSQGQLEYDFVVAPGADPRNIVMQFDGAQGLALDAGGNLLIQTAAGTVVEQAPVLYQAINGQRQPVTGQFVLSGANQVAFEVGAYDAGQTLVIDPVIAVGQENNLNAFRNTSVAKQFDPNGNNVYGEAGYIFYGIDNNPSPNADSGQFLYPTNPLSPAALTLPRQNVSSIPAYLTLSNAGQDGVTSSFNYSNIDDPRLAPSSSPPQIEYGLALHNLIAQNTEASVVNINVGAGFPASGLRVGVYIGAGEDTMKDVRLAQTAGSGASSATLVRVGSPSTYTAFFDIVGAGVGDVFTLYLTKSSADGGVNPNVAYMGLTFDVSNDFIVTNTNDSGAGSLRQAILGANASAGPAVITFNISGGGVHTIAPTSTLPTLNNTVILDATTQPGYSGLPLIELSGATAGAGVNGLTLGANNSTIKGLAINGFSVDGIFMYGSNDLITGNFIGTNAAGTTAVANSGYGIDDAGANNTIGGTAAGARNVVSGNTGDGVLLDGGSGNLVQGNYLGLNAAGTAAIANGRYGVNLVAANNTIDSNVISGNASAGVNIITDFANGTTITGNFIGTDATGMSAVPNPFGIDVTSSSNNTIGGTTAGARNVVSGNNNTGILITNNLALPASASNNLIEGNYIGTNVLGTGALGNVGGGVILAAQSGGPNVSNNTIGGTTAAARNVISGNGTNGVELNGSGTTGNTVLGNYIGTDVSGTVVLTNTGNGVRIDNGASSNTIGGTTGGAGNVISGNGNAVSAQGGVYLVNSGTTGNVVEGNLIGTDMSGLLPLGNNWDGVGIEGGASGNIIGGTAAGARNVISANAADGAGIDGPSFNNVIAGNYIGTDITGNAPLGNTLAGVRLRVGAIGNTVGGNTSAARNVISGNVTNGVQFNDSSTTGNVVEGNYIGTNAGGSAAIPNNAGVVIGGGATGNLIGTNGDGVNDAAEGNVISGNTAQGVLILGANNNKVAGNYIGTNAAGTGALSNNDGVFLQSATGNIIGTNGSDVVNSDDRNIISGNTGGNGRGIVLDGANIAAGNWIGLDVNGNALGNGYGIQVTGTGSQIGGVTDPAERNVIGSSTYDGIFVRNASTSGAVIEGNYIGLDPTGTLDRPNQRYGVQIALGANANTVGGPVAAARNVISGNASDGIHISDAGTTGNLVEGNYIGTNAAGSDVIGGAAAWYQAEGDANDVTGTNNGTLEGGVTFPSGKVGQAFSLDGTSGFVDVPWSASLTPLTGVAVEAWINLTTLPSAASPTGGWDVFNELYDNHNNPLAGQNPASGAGGYALRVLSTGAVQFIIGTTEVFPFYTKVTSAPGLVTAGAFVHVAGSYDSNTGQLSVYVNGVATTIAASGTLNQDTNALKIGADLFNGTYVQGLVDEPAVYGRALAPSEIQRIYQLGVQGKMGFFGNANGVLIANSASSNSIGGTSVGARNIISGNNTFGVQLTGSGTTGNVVQGNYVGTNVSGTLAVANPVGVVLQAGAAGNSIGGTAAGAGNVISGNSGDGIDLLSGPNLVAGNYIGTTASGGTLLANAADGVYVTSANNTIGGTTAAARNVIGGNGYFAGKSGIEITGAAATGNLIEGNYLGVNAAGTATVGNASQSYVDVLIALGASNNTVGGTTAAARNIIDGARAFGIYIKDAATSNNLIEGNYIGPSPTASTGLGNVYGINVVSAMSTTIGGMTAAARNIISANEYGVYLNGDTSVVEGNYIGTDPTGTSALANTYIGVRTASSHATIGGLTATPGTGPGNVISGNGLTGLVLFSASPVVVQGNIIGLNAAGNAALANGTLNLSGYDHSGILVQDGTHNMTIGGTAAGAGNVISGNVADGINFDGVTYQPNTADVVQGNYIGTDITGTVALGNGGNGITISGSSSMTIGGTTAAARNVISGNSGVGVTITGSGTSGNLVEGNYIGVDASGANDLRNANDGVFVQNGATNTTIGGITATPGTGAGNVISGNQLNATNFGNVHILGATTTGTVIQGNIIGLNAAGTAAVDSANSQYGVYLQNAAATIGGTAAGAGNVISGQALYGVVIESAGSAGSLVQGNIIGLGPNGTTALGSANGVVLSVGATNVTIGGTAAAARNIISGNSVGVYIHEAATTNNTVEGNYIGTDISGTLARGNSLYGVRIEAGSTGNVIGGSSAGAGNVISAAQFGVLLDGSGTTANTIAGNLIGTNAPGTAALGNQTGIQVEAGAASNTIGGTTVAARNVISGNSGAGVIITGSGTTANTVAGNWIGLDSTGAATLGNTGQDVVVASGAFGNTIGGLTPTPGTGAGNVISSPGSALFSATHVELDGNNNVVEGNLLGTDPSGTVGLDSAYGIGVAVNGASNTVGGANVQARNIISGNYADVEANPGGAGSIVLNNYIGLDITGLVALPNQTFGVVVYCPNFTIGAPGAGNVISGSFYGVFTNGATGLVMQGNFIGTNKNGTTIVAANGGVSLVGDNGFLVGGTAAGAGNVFDCISGAALDIEFTNGGLVQGNFFGSDPTGMFSNGSGYGLAVDRGATNITVGGTTAAARNIISGNGVLGLEIDGNGTQNDVVEGNYIGVNAAGMGPLTNPTGILVTSSASNDTIGGTAAGAGNVISGNLGDGIVIDGTGTPDFTAAWFQADGNTNNSSGYLIGGTVNGTVAYGSGVTGGTDQAFRFSRATPGYVSSSHSSYTLNASNVTVEGWLNLASLPAGGQEYLVAGNNVLDNPNYAVFVTNVGGSTRLGFRYLTFTGLQNIFSTPVALGTGNYHDVAVTADGTNVKFYMDGALADTEAIVGTPTDNYNNVGTDPTITLYIGGGPGLTNRTFDGRIDDLAVMWEALPASEIARIFAAGGVDLGGSATQGITVEGNFIGVNKNGTAILANAGNGITINDSFNNTIGGTATGAGNLISGNSQSGVFVTGKYATGNVVEGNLIGTDVLGDPPIPNAQDGVFISNAANNTVGGTTAAARNVLSGNAVAGVEMEGSGATGNVVLGNYIGTTADGSAALGNGMEGVLVGAQATNDTIGGSTAGAGNVISGNTDSGNGPGIWLLGSSNTVAGNLIGLNAAGTAAIPNDEGIDVGGTNNTVGGTTALARNVLSGNNAFGVYITGGSGTGNVIEGNYIGTNAAGTSAIGNTSFGIASYGVGDTIGGTAPGAGNVISGNHYIGVGLNGANNTLIQGNFVGTDATGMALLPNAIGGVTFTGNNITIGGTAMGAGNVISGNSGPGLTIGGNSALVQGNLIGTNAAGTAALANSGDGVDIKTGASGNTIGGAAPGVPSVVTGGGNFTDVYGIALAANGDLIVSDPFNNLLVRVNPQTGAQTVISSGGLLNNPDGITLAANGDIYVADSAVTVGTPNILRVNPTTGIQTLVSSGGGLVHPGDLVLGSNGSLYVTDFGAFAGNGAIFSVNPTSGVQTLLTEGNGTLLPGGIAVAANGSLYVSYKPNPATTGEVDRVDPTTGIRTAISSGGLIANPLGIAINTDGSLLVANINTNPFPALGNILHIDSTTGAQTVADSGAALAYPFELAIAPSGDIFATNRASAGGSLGQSQVVRIAANASRNVISGNTGGGVVITGNNTIDNAIRGNSIYANASLGIDLGGTGIPLDDAIRNGGGPNNYQNYPVITGVSNGVRTSVTGIFASKASTTYQLDFYANAIPDPSGFGEGQIYLGSTPVTTDINGQASFNVTTLGASASGAWITATATDPAGNTSEFSLAQTGNLSVSITGSPTTVVLGTPIDLNAGINDLAANQSYTYAWTVTRGSTIVQTATTPTIHFIADTLTDYHVTLVAHDSLQNASTAMETIHVVTAIPIVSIRGNSPDLPAPSSATYQQAVNLSNKVTELGFGPLVLSYAWTVKFGSTVVQTGTSSTFSFTPQANGFFDVFLTVTDTVCNTSNTDHITIKASGAPLSIAINGAPATSPEGSGIVLNSAFIDTVTTDSLTYQWSVTKNGVAYRPLSGAVPRYAGDPGDTDSGLGQDFRFIPDAAGTYVVTLLATSKVNGAQALDTKTIMVTDVAPVAKILGGPASTTFGGSAVNLQGAFTDPGTNEVHVLTWVVTASNGQVIPTVTNTVHPGDPVQQPAFTFTPSDAGIYTVTFTVTDQFLLSSTVTKVIDVKAVPIVPVITGAPSTGTEGSPIGPLTASVASPPGSYTFAWTVTRDGLPFATSVPGSSYSFTPNHDGKWVVTLTATTTGANPHSGSVSATIPVTNLPPLPAISGAPTSVAEGTPIQLGSAPNDPGSADTFTYKWTITGTDVHNHAFALPMGDQATYNFTPAEPGTYNVMLVVTDDGGHGLSASATKTITVTNATPLVTIVNGATASDGSVLGLHAQVTVGGMPDTFAPSSYVWSLAWVDSSNVSHPITNFVISPDGSSISFGAVTGAVSYTATVSVTDDDPGAIIGSATSMIKAEAVGGSLTLTSAPAGTNQFTVLALGSNMIDASGATANAVLIAVGGHNTLKGGTKTNYLYGDSGSNTLIGGSGTNNMFGVGIDTLIGGTGANMFNLMPGSAEVVTPSIGTGANNTLSFAGTPTSITLYLGQIGAFQTIASGSTLQLNAPIQQLFGGSGNDSLVADSGVSNVTLFGGTGDDTLVADGSSNVTLFAGTGAQQLLLAHNSPSSMLFGGSGLDTLVADTSNDVTLFGGSGNTLLHAINGQRDSLFGGDGSDTLVADGGSNITLFGGTGTDSLVADNGASNVTLFGATGNDTLTADNTSNVTLFGGTGTDSLVADNGSSNVTLFGGDGSDTLSADSASNVTLYGAASAGALAHQLLRAHNSTGAGLFGGEGSDTLIADGGSNITLFGGDGTDSLVADNSASNVTLFGGTGNDTLTADNTNDVTLFGGGGTASHQILNIRNHSTNISAFGGDGSDSLVADASSNVTLFGGTGSDTLVADDGSSNVTLFGGDGSDTLIADNSSNVTLFGGTGTDSLIADDGSSNVTLFGGDGNDTLTADNSSNVTLFGGGGAASHQILTIRNHSSGVSAFGGDGSDSLVADNSSNVTLFGGTGTDTLVADDGSSNVTLFGGTGDDTLIADNSSNVTLYGGGGVGSHQILTIRNHSSGVSAFGGDGSDSLVADNSSNVTLFGGNGTDTLVADDGSSNVTLFGGAGDDTLIADGSSNVTLYGGGGVGSHQILTIRNHSSGVSAFGGDGSDSLVADASSNVTLYGGTGTDTLVADDGSTGVTLFGGTGNDSLVADNSSNVTLYGGGAAGSHQLLTVLHGSHNVNAFGGNGDDTLIADASNQVTLFGGTGTDSLVADDGSSNVTMFGGDGNDTLTATNDTGVTLYGGLGPVHAAHQILSVHNSAGTYLYGGTGDDTLVADGGSSITLYGGDGTDSLVADNGANTVTLYGGTGNDTLVAMDDNTVTLFGGDGTDSLLADNGSTNVTMYGGTGNDTLVADDSSNVTMFGGSGNDTLIADDGSSNVTMFGGDGTDSLLASSSSDVTLYGGAGFDTLTDINGHFDAVFAGSGVDQIYLKGGTSVVAYGGGGTATFNIDGSAPGTFILQKVVPIPNNDSQVTQSAGGTDNIAFINFSAGITFDMSNQSSQTLNNTSGVMVTLVGAFDNVTGTPFADKLHGDSVPNVIDGGGGNDTLQAGSGDATLIAGHSNDLLIGGTGSTTYQFNSLSAGNVVINQPSSTANDTLDFLQVAAPVTVNLTLNTVQTVSPGLTINLLNPLAIVNFLGSMLGNTFTGNGRGDYITTGGGTNILNGNGGQNVYFFVGTTPGTTTINDVASSNTDTLDFRRFSTPINLDMSQAATQAVSSNLNLTLTNPNAFAGAVGSPGNSTIKGNARNDSLIGGGGLNLLIGGTATNFLQADVTQVVYLNFNPPNPNLGDHVFDTAEKNAILAGEQRIFQDFNYYFTMSLSDAQAHAAPYGGQFVTEYFNAGPAGGKSNDLDFRNLSLGGSMTVEVNPLLGGTNQPPAVVDDVVLANDTYAALATEIAGHELGHLSGLRHPDSYGPIGSGAYSAALLAKYHFPDSPPIYLPPTNATETPEHVMASPASVGTSLFAAVQPTFFGEREDIKLAFNDTGTVVSQESSQANHSFAMAQALGALPGLNVPNTIANPSDRDYGRQFAVQAIAVVGNLVPDSSNSGKASDDYYSLSGKAGQIMNFEAKSAALSRITKKIDTVLYLYDASGTLLATNDDDFESTDSQIIDFVLPADGQYYVRVDSFNPPNGPDLNTGQYELFMYSFVVPTASTTSLGGGSTLVGGSGNDTLVADSGNDVMKQPAFSGSYTVYGGAGYDVLYQTTPTGSVPDTIIGNVHVILVPGTVPPPSLQAITSPVVNEGTLVDFVAVATDAVPDQFTYSLGSSPTPPVGASINSSTGEFQWLPELPGNYSVQVVAKDLYGHQATQIVNITVKDVAPTIHLASTAQAPEGTTFSLSGFFTALGQNPWTATVNYDDGTGTHPLTLTGKTFTLSHVYPEEGPHNVVVTINDGFGGTPSQSVAVTVTDFTPVVNLGNPVTIQEGGMLTGTASFTDPSADASWTATIDYGDGSGVHPLTLNTNKTFALSHTYLITGQHTVTVKVTDDEHVVGTGTLQVTVQNVAPSNVSAGPDQTVFLGQQVTLSGSFTDPGAGADPATFKWHAVNSNGQTIADGTGQTFTFTPTVIATYTFLFSVTDDNGASGAATVKVNVLNPATNTSISAPTVTYGQDGMVKVTVGSTNTTPPTGIVTLSVDGGSPLSGTLVNGSYTFDVGIRSAGDHSLLASFAAQNGFFGSSSAGNLHVNKANPAVVATGGTFTYDGNPHAGSGTATGALGENLTPVTISYNPGGSAVPVNAGSYMVTASYAGSSNYNPGSGTATLTINPAPTKTVISAPTVLYGTHTLVTVTVSNTATSPVPTGTVSLTVDSGTPFTHALNGAGAWTFDVGVLSYGPHSLSASFPAQGNFAASSSTGSAAESISNSAYVLSATAAGALTVSVSGRLQVTGIVDVDSNSSSAITASGNALISAAAIQVVGGAQSSGSAHLSPTPVTGAPSFADPLLGLTAPSITGTKPYPAVNVSGSSSLTLSPGIYSSISVSNQGKLTLATGIYVIAGGGFSVTGNGTVTGSTSGVMIYNAGSNYPNSGGSFGSINFSGNGTVSLTPLSTGTYAGNLIFQSRDNASALALTGNAINLPSGVVYAPAASVTLSGNVQLGGTVIANTLNITGQGTFNQLTSGGATVYTPAQVRTGYGVCNLALDGTGQTIAIVDAYHNPTIYQAVDTFDSQFGGGSTGASLFQLYGPAATFLTVLNQQGQAAPLPGTDPTGAGTGNWEMESALDVEWAHAVAPGARILLVEANSQSLADLMAAVASAANQPGASVVSMSWGFPEGQAVFAQDEALYDHDLTTPTGHQGVTFVASTGDYGTADPEYPSFSPNVVAVGGTSLYLNVNNTYGSETGWGYTSSALGGIFIGTGGGVSQFEAEPGYQTAVQSTGYRTTPDVSLVADPATGAWIADPYNLPADNPFAVVGGTSLSAPSWAGLFTLVNQQRTANGLATLGSAGPTETQQALYNVPVGDFNDVTSGTNSGFNAGAGYDLVTGLGTPVADHLVLDLAAYTGAASSQRTVTVTSATVTASTGGSQSPNNAVRNVIPVFDAEFILAPGLGLAAHGQEIAVISRGTMAQAAPLVLPVKLVSTAATGLADPRLAGAKDAITPVQPQAAPAIVSASVTGTARGETTPAIVTAPASALVQATGAPSVNASSSATAALHAAAPALVPGPILVAGAQDGFGLLVWTAPSIGANQNRQDDGDLILIGGDGDNILIGGEGRDFLIGGIGAENATQRGELSDAADYHAKALGVVLAGTTSTSDYSNSVDKVMEQFADGE
jgi:Ca2+-binding RTX toxin-like protein